MIPIIGSVSTGGKLAVKGSKAIEEAQDASKAVDNINDGAKDTGNIVKDPLINGSYIKNGKPNGRPQLSGKKKLEFETEVYNMQVDPDEVLRDPNTDAVIDWIPGKPRKGIVDFGHTEGNSYSKMFEKYKNREIDLDDLKEFQYNPDNYRLETPSTNRSHEFE